MGPEPEKVDDNKHYWDVLAPEYMRVVKAGMEEFFKYNGRYPKLDEEYAGVWAYTNARI